MVYIEVDAPSPTTIILLAAGLSRRMGSANKLLHPIAGHSTLLQATLANVTSVDIDQIIVVTGYQFKETTEIASAHHVDVVYNPNFERGMGSTIKTGVHSAKLDHGLLIWPADLPFVRPETIAMLLSDYTPESIVRPTYQGQPGHPVLFGSQFRSDLLDIEDASGARSVLEKNRPSVRLLEVSDIGVIRDFDTGEDFEKHK